MPTQHNVGTSPLDPTFVADTVSDVTTSRPLVAGRTTWQRKYVAVVKCADIVVITACVLVGVALGAGLPNDAAVMARAVSGVVAGILMISGLWLARSWDSRVFGNGAAELGRVARAIAGSAVVLGLVGLALQVDSVRLWVFGIMPACGLLCLAERYAIRKLLHARRARGRCMLPVLVVGSEPAVAELVRRTRRDKHFGWDVTGACTPTGTGLDGESTIGGVPVVGDLDVVGSVARSGGYRVVAVASTPGWGSARTRQLAWQLEGTATELAVDPGLMEFAGPRLHIAPVDGLPLLCLSEPRFTGVGWLVKSTVDRMAAILLIGLLLPVFLSIAVAVRRDGGPVFYRQERVGAGGRTFRMVKFRSMSEGADRQVDAMATRNEAAGPLFKMRKDPRVTPVGAVLRRYSLDELPQLFNVAAGSMSLVGPRPPLAREVAQYGPDARRRLLVRPGITGLWQVSGRSDLSWEESVRLDLRYVENWSLTLDIMVLWKTLGAVVQGRGAY